MSDSKKRFFAIEGLDGVGKSTLISNLSNLGYATYKTPPDEYKSLRPLVHSLKDTSLFFYLSSIAYVMEKLTREEDDFFVDRYIFSTISQYVSNSTKTISEFETLFENLSSFFILPSITFFLTLDYDIRMKRISHRSVEEKRLDNMSKEYDLAWNNMIDHYSFSRKVILDANKNEEELVQDVLYYIKQGS